MKNSSGGLGVGIERPSYYIRQYAYKNVLKCAFEISFEFSEIFEDAGKTESVYFNMNQEILYMNMSRGNILPGNSTPHSSGNSTHNSSANSENENSDYSKMYHHHNVSEMIARQVY